MASGATDVLARARIVATLDEALDGMHHVVRHRDDAARLRPADARAARAFRQRWRAQRRRRVAFVFGSERFGMRNEDVYRCHACLSIPTDPSYGSLNLAQAVQLIAYEWRQALGGFAVRPRTRRARRWPTRAAVQAAADALAAGAGGRSVFSTRRRPRS